MKLAWPLIGECCCSWLTISRIFSKTFAKGSSTVFTQSVASAPLGLRLSTPLNDLTTRALNFGCQVMRQVDRLSSDHSVLECAAQKRKSLKEMIRMSYSLLLIWSAGASANLYTGNYLADLETHSPFRFAPLATKRKKLSRWTARLARMFESFLKDEEEDESASVLLASFLMPRSMNPATQSKDESIWGSTSN